MKRKLLTFGDSWPYGTELLKTEQPYGRILANRFNCDIYENLAIPGSAVESLIYQLMNYSKRHDLNDFTMAVFHITGLARAMFIDDKNKPVYYKIPPADAHVSTDPNHIYFKYFHSHNNDMFNAQRTLITLQGMCRAMNIKDFYISCFTKIDTKVPGIDESLILPKTCLELFGIDSQVELESNNNIYIYPKNWHPNQRGHELIAQELYNWISPHVQS